MVRISLKLEGPRFNSFPKFSFFSFSLHKMDEKNVTPKQLLQASCC
jgi:hypothetical protein